MLVIVFVYCYDVMNNCVSIVDIWWLIVFNVNWLMLDVSIWLDGDFGMNGNNFLKF